MEDLTDQFLFYTALRISPTVGINFIIGNIVASHFNTTLITNDHPRAKNNSIFKSQRMHSYPQILPHVQVHGGVYQVSQIWNAFCPWKNTSISNVSQCPSLIKAESIEYNFAYCAPYATKYDSTWHFRILSDPFDVWIWLVLFALLIIVSWLVSISTNRGFGLTLLSTFAVLLDNEMTRTVSSKLYVLWLFVTLLICDFYTGHITSQVIAPLEQVTLKKFTELINHQYSIIFSANVIHSAISLTISQLNVASFVHPTVKDISRLIKNAKVFNYRHNLFTPALAEKELVATVIGWEYCIAYAVRGNAFISRKKKATRAKRCHIGKELFNIGEKFIMITPPENGKISGVVQRLLAFGILQRWDREMLGLLYAERHQDRVRVKSKTNLVKEEATIEPLHLVGKIKTIFVLWSLCLVSSVSAFTIEILRKFEATSFLMCS